MQFLGVFFFVGMVLEFMSLFLVASWLGWGALGLMILGFLVGSMLLRHNIGLTKAVMAGQFLRGGGISFYDMFLPIRIPLAGVLLAIPTGFLSSLLGLVLLLPFKIGKAVPKDGQQHQPFSGGFQYQYHAQSKQNNQKNHDDVIEGEYTVKSGKHQAQKHHDVIEHQK